MASVPSPIASVLDSPGFQSGKFWSARIASFVAAGIVLYAFHNFAAPKLGIYDVGLLSLSFLFATLAVSLNLINGVTGQFSIGHAAFYLIGAITSAKLTVTFMKASNLPGPLWMLIMVLVGGAAAAIAGFIIGLPSLRLRGDYLAVATLGFGEIVNVILRNQDGGKQSFGGLDLGGPYGLQSVPKLTQTWYIFLLFIVTVAFARNLVKNAHGLSFLAVREDELAADATGVNSTKIKVTAFVLGAAIAGMAGALYAHYNGSVPPDDFKMDTSFILVAMVVIGGTGSITGAAAAGVTLKLLEEGLRKVPPIPALDLYSLILLGIAAFAAYKALDKRGRLNLDGKLRPLWTILGLALCAYVAYLGYKTYGSDLSWVLKIASMVFMALLLLGMLAGRRRSASLTRLGFFGFCVGIILLAKPLVAAPLHSVGLLQTLLGDTTYKASDLRWAIFSLSLVFVMILRPQGIMGHHEFSWAFVKEFFAPHVNALRAVLRKLFSLFRRPRRDAA